MQAILSHTACNARSATIHRVCHHTLFGGVTLDGMEDHETYKRLLEAAKSLRGWESPTDIAKGLTENGYDVAQQRIGNWKSRGVSVDAIVDVCRIIGCRPAWLKFGDGLMEDINNPLMEALVNEAKKLSIDEQHELIAKVQFAISLKPEPAKKS